MCSCGSPSCKCVENYSHDQKIGDMTQKDFDVAMRKAIRHIQRSERKMTPAMAISGVLYMVVIIWAVLLAMSVEPKARTTHLVFAILFSPAYIIAYYMGKLVLRK